MGTYCLACRNSKILKRKKASPAPRSYPNPQITCSELPLGRLLGTSSWSQQQSLETCQLSCLKSLKKKSSSSPVAIYMLSLLLSLWRCLSYANKSHPYSSPLNIKKWRSFFLFELLFFSFFFFSINRMQRKDCVQLCISAALPELLHCKNNIFLAFPQH